MVTKNENDHSHETIIVSKSVISQPFDRLKRRRVQLTFTEPSLTDSSFKDECDIHNIIKKHQVTGLIDHVNRYEGRYEDLTTLPMDYKEALESVLEAQEAFDSLPSSLRQKFENDPGKFLEFVSDSNNAQEMVELGLARPNHVDVTPEPKVPNDEVVVGEAGVGI